MRSDLEGLREELDGQNVLVVQWCQDTGWRYAQVREALGVRPAGVVSYAYVCCGSTIGHRVPDRYSVDAAAYLLPPWAAR